MDIPQASPPSAILPAIMSSAGSYYDDQPEPAAGADHCSPIHVPLVAADPLEEPSAVEAGLIPEELPQVPVDLLAVPLMKPRGIKRKMSFYTSDDMSGTLTMTPATPNSSPSQRCLEDHYDTDHPVLVRGPLADHIPDLQDVALVVAVVASDQEVI